MIETPLGKIMFTINGSLSTAQPIVLSTHGKAISVDGRLLIVFNLSSYASPIIIEGILESELHYTCGAASGQELASISFTSGDCFLNIGFEGDIPNVRYQYLKDRIRITIPSEVSLNSISCVVAWVKRADYDEGYSQAWLAADPTSVDYF